MKKKTNDTKDTSQKNSLIKMLREDDKKGLFETTTNTAFFKTGFAILDHYIGSVVNVFDENGKITGQLPRLGIAAGSINTIIGGSGGGKAQPNTTKIPTPDGYKLMGDLKVGDKVFGLNGQPIKVIGVYPQGKRSIYQLTFNDGRTANCCEDHLWEVYYEMNGTWKCDVLSLKEMISKDRFFRKTRDGKWLIDKYKFKIPTLQSHVQYNRQEVPIDPYILGTYIGNDWLTKKWLFNFSELSVKFKDVLKDKMEIPEIYLYNDYESRIQLLKGLMDANGKVSYIRGHHKIEYYSNSEILLKQIQQLVRGLGWNAILSNRNTRNTDSGNVYKGKLTFSVSNDFKKEMFIRTQKLLSRKIDKLDPVERTRYSDEYNWIRSIKIIETNVESTCIKVEAEDSLYITEDFVVTHNTTLCMQLAANIIRPYENAQCIHYDMEKRMDLSRVQIITKLPLKDFKEEEDGRYILKTDIVSLENIQETIVKLYAKKMKAYPDIAITLDDKDEFGRNIVTLPPTVIIIDSYAQIIQMTFSYDNVKEVEEAGKLAGNTEGARSAKSVRGFFRDIIPLCKEANIIIIGINHITGNMSMNAFLAPKKQQAFLKQDEAMPQGTAITFVSHNMLKLIGKQSDNFTEEKDGVVGHKVLVEPIKSSTNQSGNGSSGVFFTLVFTNKYGFDPVRSLINYGKDIGLIEGNVNRYKFVDDPSYTFSMKILNKEIKEKPIWSDIKKYIIPTLGKYLSYVEPENVEYDENIMDY